MVEPQFPIPDDPMENHGGRFQLADLFNKANQANEDSAYGEWTKGINAAQHLNLETPDSFIESAPLDVDEQRWIDSMCGLARENREAFCNNRLEYLIHKAAEREQLQTIINSLADGEKYEPPQVTVGAREILTLETHEVLRLLAPAKSHEDKVDIEHRLASINADIVRVVGGIERDIEKGYFRDHYRAKLRYTDPDPHKLQNGPKVLEMPYFGKEAISFCLSRMQGTRQTNAQSLWARMVAKLGMAANERQSRTSRRRRRSRSDEDDEE